MKIADSIPRKQSHSGNEWNAAAVSDVTKEIVKTNPFEDGITTAVLPKRSQIDSVNAQQFVLDDGITSSDFAKTNPFEKCVVLRNHPARTLPRNTRGVPKNRENKAIVAIENLLRTRPGQHDGNHNRAESERHHIWRNGLRGIEVQDLRC